MDARLIGIGGPMNLRPGINDCTNEQYHKDRNYKSSSSLKLFLKDPRTYYKKYVLQEHEETGPKAAYDFGSYVHSLILEPEKTEQEFAVFEGLTRRGKAYQEFKEQQEGKIIITQSQHQQAMGLMQLYEDCTDTDGLIQDGLPEHTLCVELEGMNIKVRTDYIKDGMVIDVKTTSDPVDKYSAAKTIVRFDYDLSAALYLDAFEKYTGKKHDFIFVFLNKTLGDISVLKADDSIIENGRRKYKAAIKRLKIAEETGIYFDNEKMDTVELPGWAEFHDK